MRTTVDINPKYLRQLRQRAHDLNLSLKEVLEHVLQRGLAEPAAKPVEPFATATHDFGLMDMPWSDIKRRLHDNEDLRVLRNAYPEQPAP